MNKIILALTLAVILAVSIALYFDIEKFEADVLYPENTFYLSNYPTILSNGTVQKTLLKSKEYLYEYFYNLPTTYSAFQIVRPGVAFNDKLPDEEYKVYAGLNRDKLVYVGNLKRRGDGYHLLTFTSKEDYKVTCITLKDKAIHCVEI